MGTASLVFGLVLIGFGILFTIVLMGAIDSEGVYINLIFIILSFAIGGLLLRTFDKDRQKDRKTLDS